MAFRWSDVKAPVLRGLAKAAGVPTADAAAGLAKKFGKVPDERFDRWTRQL